MKITKSILILSIALVALVSCSSEDPQPLVAKKDQTITFSAIADKTVGDAAFNLEATTTSNLEITFESSNTSVATISGDKVTIIGAGMTTITASQIGDDKFNPATAKQNLVVKDPAKIDQTITFEPLANRKEGGEAFTLEATTTSNLAIVFESSNPEVATISGNTVTIVKGGITTITASQAGNDKYNPASMQRDLNVIAKNDQTITFGALAPKKITDAAFDLTATTTSNLAITYVSSDPTVATISGKTVTIVGSGTTKITASQAGNDDFNAATSITQDLIVNAKSNQTITFNALDPKAVGDAAFDLTGTTTSGLAITYVSSDPTVATISGSTVTIVGAGTTTITASQIGDADFNAAITVSRDLAVTAAPIVIDLPAIQAEIVGMKFKTTKALLSNGTILNEGDLCGNSTVKNLTIEFISSTQVNITNNCNGMVLPTYNYTLTYNNGVFNILVTAVSGGTTVINAHFVAADFVKPNGDLKTEVKGTFKQLTTGAWANDPTMTLTKI